MASPHAATPPPPPPPPQPPGGGQAQAPVSHGDADAEHHDVVSALGGVRLADDPAQPGGRGEAPSPSPTSFGKGGPLDQEAILEAAESFVREAFRDHDPSHDMHHVHRVRLMAVSLTRCPSLRSKPDLLVVELAALFHDLCDAKYLPSGQAGAHDAAAKASAVLAPFFASGSPGHALPPHQRELICRIVDNVSWSKEERRRAAKQQRDSRQGRAEVDGEEATPSEQERWLDECAELACVSDADRLDAIGSFGILRCAAFSAVRHRPLHVAPRNALATSAPPHEQSQGYGESAVAHFYQKLLHVKEERLRTDMARKEAERRQGMMRSFLDELDFEWFMAERGAQLALLDA